MVEGRMDDLGTVGCLIVIGVEVVSILINQFYPKLKKWSSRTPIL